MLAVIFEVWPSAEGMRTYLDLAASLRPQLERTPGFVSIERWRSLTRDGWILSLSLWQDEAALTRWRVCPAHHDAQVTGRGGVFRDYRLRVAQIASDDHAGEPRRVPARRTAYNDPAARAARFVGLAQGMQRELGAARAPAAVYESLVNAGKHTALFELADEPDTHAWRDGVVAQRLALRVMTCEIERDYGMFDRAEAPQYYPPVSL